jgi:hypothetical protein
VNKFTLPGGGYTAEFPFVSWEGVKMRSVRWLVALYLAACAAAALADTAGQVMFAYGETHALRQGRIVVLHAGAPVESGDQLHTGVDSYLQVRFTDWGVMSLRPHTDFVIDEYAYEQRVGGVERAFFSLLNGGVRSLTGLIGRRNHSHYHLRTTVTSIGIRGTHYSVLICNQDCKLDDGSLGEDGVYGGVIEGRIAVSPYGGASLEREFAAGEYFRLESANSIPERFFTPPSFFWDKREPQARSGARTFAGVPWKPAPGVVLGPGPGAGGDPAAIAGSLVRTDGSLALSPITAPLLNQPVLPALTQTGAQLGSAVAALAGPVMPVVGSTLNGLVTSPLVAPVTTTALTAVGSVVAPITPVIGSTVGAIAAPVTPVIGSTVGAVAAPVAPVIGSVGSITAPVIAPVAPVIAPVVAPVVPIVAPVMPVVTAPPTTIALPTLPTLPVTGGLPSLLPKK